MLHFYTIISLTSILGVGNHDESEEMSPTLRALVRDELHLELHHLLRLVHARQVVDRRRQ